MSRIGKPKLAGLAYFGLLIAAIVIGVIIGGGAGTTVTAIAAALFALAILGAVGPGVAARDSLRRRGRSFGSSLDDEDQRDRQS